MLGANDDLTGGSSGAYDPTASASAAEVGYLSLSAIGCALYHNGISFPSHANWAGDLTIFGCSGQVKILHVGWDFQASDGSVLKHYDNNNVGVVAKVKTNPFFDGLRYQETLKKLHKGPLTDPQIWGMKICLNVIPWGYPGAQEGRVCNTIRRIPIQ